MCENIYYKYVKEYKNGIVLNRNPQTRVNINGYIYYYYK